MKKSILNLGKALNKADQKNINGGMLGGFDPCPPSLSFTLDGYFTRRDGSIGRTCSYPSTLADTIFPGSRCTGEVVGSVCHIYN